MKQEHPGREAQESPGFSRGEEVNLADLHVSRKREKAPTRALGAGGGSWFARAGSGSGEQVGDLLPPAVGHGFEGAFAGQDQP